MKKEQETQLDHYFSEAFPELPDYELSSTLLPITCGCCSVAQMCLTVCDSMDCSYQAPLSFTISWTLLKFMSINLVMLSNHLILCHCLLVLPLIFPRIRIFSKELALPIR